MQSSAGAGSVVLAEAALLERRNRALPDHLREAVAGDEVAKQRVALALVDANIDRKSVV